MDYTLIAAWVMALGTWVLAGATLYYHRKTFKISQQQVEIVAKDKERPQIKELIGAVIIPLGFKLDERLDVLKAKKFYWNHKRMESRDIQELDVRLLSFYVHKFPRLQVEISHHNVLISGLIGALKTMDKIIYNPSFERECLELVARFNEESPDYRVPQDKIPSAPGRIVSYIIGNEKELPKENPYYHFWKKYASRFLKIREKDEKVKIAIIEINTYTNMLISESNIFSGTLEKEMQRLLDEYGITVDEVKKRFETEKDETF